MKCAQEDCDLGVTSTANRRSVSERGLVSLRSGTLISSNTVGYYNMLCWVDVLDPMLIIGSRTIKQSNRIIVLRHPRTLEFDDAPPSPVSGASASHVPAAPRDPIVLITVMPRRTLCLSQILSFEYPRSLCTVCPLQTCIYVDCTYTHCS